MDKKVGGTTAVEPSEELVAWADSTDCATCHTKQADAADNEKTTAFAHASLQLACIDCHTDDELISIHDGATADSKQPRKLKKSTFDQAVCLSCHDDATLADATRDSEALTDANGTTVNPHELPDVEEHKDTTCTSCHKMHSTKSIEKTANAYCATCHHAEVFECHTCHE